ncbi:hypothetical protein AB0B45_18500 [Nonomuraea sp. NPDC049152]|uniref:hypothetical protein n=1 Tax=Nonomuraea sp. NPDC049152 TaxID=3154350 RepID=UPI0033E8CB9F
MSDQQPYPYGSSDSYGLHYPSEPYDPPSHPPIPYGQQIPGPFGHPAVPYTRQRPPGPPPPRKEPAISVLLSFFLPGVGSIVNGDTAKGVGILVGSYAALFFGIILTFVLIGFLILPVAFGLWVWGLVDAYQGAVRANQRNGYPS